MYLPRRFYFVAHTLLIIFSFLLTAWKALEEDPEKRPQGLCLPFCEYTMAGMGVENNPDWSASLNCTIRPNGPVLSNTSDILFGGFKGSSNLTSMGYPGLNPWFLPGFRVKPLGAFHDESKEIEGIGKRFLASTMAGPIVIDQFTTNQASLSDPPGGASNVTTGGTDIIGTRRNLALNILSGVGPVTAGVAGGVLNFSVTATTPDSRGKAVLTWDGDTNPNVLSPMGLGGVDLTSMGNNLIRLVVNSASAGLELILTVYSSSGNASVAAAILPVIASPTNIDFPYAGFAVSEGAGANFSSVGAIVLTILGTEKTCVIDRIDATTDSPVITANQTDEITIDNGAPAKADPNDRIRYQATIQNNGSAPANGVQLSTSPDPVTTLVSGSFRSSPLAANDMYVSTGNVGIDIPAVTGVKSNDFDNLLGSTTLSLSTPPAFGSVTLMNDGSFSYSPAAGFSGVDQFTYTLTDGDPVGGTVPVSDQAKVTIIVENLIWFVDNTGGGTGGTGTLTDPFKRLADFNASSGPQAGQIVFVKHTGTKYGGGILLKNNMFLFGTGHSGGANLADVLPFGDVPNSKTLPAINGTRPVIDAQSGGSHGITLASGNTIRGLEIGRCIGAKIFGNNFGTLTIGNTTSPDVTLNGNLRALDLTNGNFAATSKFASISCLDSSTIILNTVGGSLASGSTTVNANGSGGNITMHIQNSTAALDFGATTVNNLNGQTCVSITNSSMGSVTFSNLSMTSAGNGTGLLANNGGTINIGGTGSAITARLALDISNTSFGSGATFASITSSASSGKGVNLDNVTGSVIINGGSIQNSSGIAFDLNGGTNTVTYSGTINNANRAVEVTGRTGGTVTFSGNITNTGTGINVASNTGGTVAFSGSSKSLNTGANTAVTIATNTGATINFTGGGLVISTTSGMGFNATGGGTVTVQGTGNTISSTSATALNVVSTTIGASGMTFQSISSGNNTAAADPVNGIVLNTTGSSGGLTVTGDGGGSNNGSGGVIQNTTATGVNLTSTSSVSLNYINIQNGADDGVSGISVTGFTMTRCNVTNNGNALNDSGLDFGGASSSLTGMATITNCSITSNYHRQMLLDNDAGTVTITITGCTINGRAAENNNDDGILAEAGNTATVNISITNSSFSANKGDHFQAAALNSGNLDVTFNNNTLTGGHSTALGQGVVISAATAAPGYSGTVSYEIKNNNINGAIASSIHAYQGTSSSACIFSGVIQNNIVGTSGVAGSGSAQGFGVYVEARGNGNHTSLVTGNTIRQCFDRGINLESGDGSAVFNITIQSNIIDQQVGVDAREAIQTNFGITPTNVFGVEDAPVICLQLGGPGVLANTFSHGAGAPDDFRLRKRFSATVRLPGYGGGTGQDAGSLAQVVAFIQGQNTGSAGEPGSASASGAGGGYTGGAACTTP